MAGCCQQSRLQIVLTQVAPPLRIMVNERYVHDAWTDPDAHEFVDHLQCPPAHAMQNPQVSTGCSK